MVLHPKNFACVIKTKSKQYVKCRSWVQYSIKQFGGFSLRVASSLTWVSGEKEYSEENFYENSARFSLATNVVARCAFYSLQEVIINI